MSYKWKKSANSSLLKYTTSVNTLKTTNGNRKKATTMVMKKHFDLDMIPDMSGKVCIITGSNTGVSLSMVNWHQANTEGNRVPYPICLLLNGRLAKPVQWSSQAKVPMSL